MTEDDGRSVASLMNRKTDRRLIASRRNLYRAPLRPGRSRHLFHHPDSTVTFTLFHTRPSISQSLRVVLAGTDDAHFYAHESEQDIYYHNWCDDVDCVFGRMLRTAALDPRERNSRRHGCRCCRRSRSRSRSRCSSRRRSNRRRCRRSNRLRGRQPHPERAQWRLIKGYPTTAGVTPQFSRSDYRPSAFSASRRRHVAARVAPYLRAISSFGSPLLKGEGLGVRFRPGTEDFA